MDGNAFFSYLLQQKQISKKTSPYIHLDTLKQFLATFQQYQKDSTEKSQEKFAQDQSTWEREKEPFLPDSIEESNETSRYKFLEKLGQGGMGVVQLVQDSLLGRKVALKSIKTFNKKGLSRNQKIQLWRLHKEAEITAILEHPNIVPLYDLEKKPTGEINFTMRKVEGDTFKTILKSVPENKKEESKLLSILLKVCDAVAYAHNQLIIHRDLKPENIMVGEFGEVYVMDWGIAKKIEAPHSNFHSNGPLFSSDQDDFQENSLEKTQEGTMATQEAQAADFATRKGIGTIGYMAPEQMKAASSVTTQADIYSLGIILKECFLRYSPIEMFELELKSYQAQENSITTEVSKTFENKIPTDIKAIIQKASASKQTERYHSVLEFKEDIEKYLENKQVSVRDYPILEILWKWSKRHRKNITLISVSVFIGVMAIFYLQWWKKQQLLKQHMSRLSYWIETLKDPQPGMRDMALLEISKMQEKEIFERLIQIVEQGNTYLLKEKAPDPVKVEYHKTIVAALGWLENPKAGPFLIKSLNKIHKKILTLPETSITHIQYMISLTQSLAFSKTKNASSFLLQLRAKMPSEGLFQQRTQLALGMLIELDDIENAENRTHAEKALFYKEAGNLKEALKNITYAIKENPKQTAFLYHNRGSIKFYLKDFKGALKDFKGALKLKPNFIPTHQMLSNFYQQRGDLELALQHLNHTIRLSKAPTSVYYLTRGNIKATKKDFKGAIKDFTKGIQLFPTSAEAYNNRALAKQESGDREGALEDFNSAIYFNPHYLDAYLNRGYYYYKKGKMDKAIADFNRAIREDNKFAQAYHNRGMAKEQKKDYEGAIADYIASIQFDPKDSKSYQRLIVLKEMQQKFREAIHYINLYMKISPKDAAAYRMRAEFKSNLKDFKGALKDFTIAKQLAPKNATLYFQLGEFYWQQNKFEKAISSFEEGLQYKFNSRAANQLTKYLLYMAAQYYRQKDYESAKEKMLQFQKYAPKTHPQYSKVKQMLQQIEKLLQKQKK